MAANRVRNIPLHQKHQAIVPKMHVPYGLGGVKSMDVPDIVSSKVYPWGAGGPAPRWRRYCVEMIYAIKDRVGEAYSHYYVPATPLTCGTQNPQKVQYIPSRKTYGRVRSPWNRNTQSIYGGDHTEPTVSDGSHRSMMEIGPPPFPRPRIYL